MTNFMMIMNFTEQGARSIKDAPKRTEAARQLGKKMGVEIKQIYVTAGESDLVAGPTRTQPLAALEPTCTCDFRFISIPMMRACRLPSSQAEVVDSLLNSDDTVF